MENSLRSGCTFEWKIGNIWYCGLKQGEPLESPLFNLGHSTLSKWSLILYPRGVRAWESEQYVGVYLRRENDVRGPNIINVTFQLAILDTNGSILKAGNVSKCFAKGSFSGIEKFVTQDELLGTEKEKIFPRNALIIRCTIWIKGKMYEEHYGYASTHFNINRGYFVFKINGFSTFIPQQTNHFRIINESKKVLATFYLTSGLKGEITLDITLWDEGLKTFSFKVLVIDSEGGKINFGKHKFFGSNFERIKKLLISREQLMQNGSQYLPNDVLSLVCEYAFSTGNNLHMLYEGHNFVMEETISPAVTKELKENKKKSIVSQNEPHQPQALVDDLKSMYSDAVLCDIELRTSTQTFPVHKIILSARSPVFRRMFTYDMREKNSGHVDITDLEDETLHRMLLYMYTDVTEDLQFESASKLYSAADKYAILYLKEKCSCFLKDNLSPTKACELFILADRHQDDDLIRAVQDYILSHDKEVFSSLEWKYFMETNLQLASDIMYRKVCPS